MRRDEEKKKQSEKENGERDTVTMGWGEKKKEKKKIENAWKYVIPNTYPWNLHCYVWKKIIIIIVVLITYWVLLTNALKAHVKVYLILN